jgi:hypothetical protein
MGSEHGIRWAGRNAAIPSAEPLRPRWQPDREGTDRTSSRRAAGPGQKRRYATLELTILSRERQVGPDDLALRLAWLRRVVEAIAIHHVVPPASVTPPRAIRIKLAARNAPNLPDSDLESAQLGVREMRISSMIILSPG